MSIPRRCAARERARAASTWNAPTTGAAQRPAPALARRRRRRARQHERQQTAHPNGTSEARSQGCGRGGMRRHAYGARPRADRPSARDLLQIACATPARSARDTAHSRSVPVSSATTPAAGRGRAPPASTSRRSASSAGPSARLVGRRGADHEHDLAARTLARRSAPPARPPCRARPPRGASSARGRPRPAARGRAPRAPPATPPPAAATRTPRASPATRSTAVELALLARQEADEAPRRGRQARSPTSAASAALGPGSTSTASPAATHACTSTSPGSLTSGIPASLTSATTAPGAHPLDQPRRHAPLVVRVVAHALGRHAVAVEQHLRRARVLAGDDVGLAQRAQHAQRDVLEVADRRRADDRAVRSCRSARPPATSSAMQAAPSIPASAPKRAGTIRTPSRRRAARARATTSRAGASSSSPAAIAPPPTTTTSGLKMLTSVDDAEAQALAHERRSRRAAAVAVVGELGDERARDLAPGGERAPEPGCRAASRATPQPVARRSRGPTRTPPGSRGSGSRPGTAARRRRRPCGRARPAAPRAPRTSAPVDDQPAADARAERQHDRVAALRAPRRSATRRASPRWRRCRRRRAARAARPSGRARRRRRAAGGWTSSATPVAGIDQARDRRSRPRATSPGAASPASRTASTSWSMQRAGVVRARQAVGAVMHLELRVDRPGEQLRPSEVDADDAAGGHDRPPYPAHGRSHRHGRPPEYKLYRTRPRLARARRATTDRCSTSCAARRPASAEAQARSRVGRVGQVAGRSALVGWVGLSLVLFLVCAQFNQDQVSGAAQAAARPRRRRDLSSRRRRSSSAPTSAARRHQGARREHVGPEPLGLDPAHAHRRRPQRQALDPARHGRRHPRPRPQQDQRRLRDRRRRAHGPDGQAVPRDRDRPRLRGQLRQLPRPHRRDGRRSTTRGGCVVSRINGGFKNGGFTLRLQARDDAHRRQAGARPRAHAPQRLQPQARTTSRARAASRRSSAR